MKIIVLDDSATVRMIVESFLEELGIHEDEVFLFEDGHDALHFINDSGADIVLSDFNMPKMSGCEFARELFMIREDLKNSFFGISGDETRESYARMREQGVQRFIKKPIKLEHFKHFVYPEILKCRKREEALNA